MDRWSDHSSIPQSTDSNGYFGYDILQNHSSGNGNSGYNSNMTQQHLSASHQNFSSNGAFSANSGFGSKPPSSSMDNQHDSMVDLAMDLGSFGLFEDGHGEPTHIMRSNNLMIPNSSNINSIIPSGSVNNNISSVVSGSRLTQNRTGQFIDSSMINYNNDFSNASNATGNTPGSRILGLLNVQDASSETDSMNSTYNAQSSSSPSWLPWANSTDSGINGHNKVGNMPFRHQQQHQQLQQHPQFQQHANFQQFGGNVQPRTNWNTSLPQNNVNNLTLGNNNIGIGGMNSSPMTGPVLNSGINTTGGLSFEQQYAMQAPMESNNMNFALHQQASLHLPQFLQQQQQQQQQQQHFANIHHHNNHFPTNQQQHVNHHVNGANLNHVNLNMNMNIQHPNFHPNNHQAFAQRGLPLGMSAESTSMANNNTNNPNMNNNVMNVQQFQPKHYFQHLHSVPNNGLNPSDTQLGNGNHGNDLGIMPNASVRQRGSKVNQNHGNIASGNNNNNNLNGGNNNGINNHSNNKIHAMQMQAMMTQNAIRMHQGVSNVGLMNNNNNNNNNGNSSNNISNINSINSIINNNSNSMNNGNQRMRSNGIVNLIGNNNNINEVLMSMNNNNNSIMMSSNSNNMNNNTIINMTNGVSNDLSASMTFPGSSNGVSRGNSMETSNNNNSSTIINNSGPSNSSGNNNNNISSVSHNSSASNASTVVESTTPSTSSSSSSSSSVTATTAVTTNDSANPNPTTTTATATSTKAEKAPLPPLSEKDLSQLEALVTRSCREILRDALSHSLKAVELANTLRARVGCEVLAHVREQCGGLLSLLEKHPPLPGNPLGGFRVNRIPKNDMVTLLVVPATAPGGSVPGTGSTWVSEDFSNANNATNPTNPTNPNQDTANSDLNADTATVVSTTSSAPSTSGGASATITSTTTGTNPSPATNPNPTLASCINTNVVSRTLGVFNLGPHLHEGDLIADFQPFGSIESVRIISSCPNSISLPQLSSSSSVCSSSSVTSNTTVTTTSTSTSRGGASRVGLVRFESLESAIMAKQALSRLAPWKNLIAFYPDSGSSMTNNGSSTSANPNGTMINDGLGSGSNSTISGTPNTSFRSTLTDSRESSMNTASFSSNSENFAVLKEALESPLTFLSMEILSAASGGSGLGNIGSIGSIGNSISNSINSSINNMNNSNNNSNNININSNNNSSNINANGVSGLFDSSDMSTLTYLANNSNNNNNNNSNANNSMNPNSNPNLALLSLSAANNANSNNPISSPNSNANSILGLVGVPPPPGTPGCPVLQRLCDDRYVPTQAWPVDLNRDAFYFHAVMSQLQAFGGGTSISKLRGFLRSRVNAHDNIKSVPLKALLAAYPTLFVLRGNQVSLTPLAVSVFNSVVASVGGSVSSSLNGNNSNNNNINNNNILNLNNIVNLNNAIANTNNPMNAMGGTMGPLGPMGGLGSAASGSGVMGVPNPNSNPNGFSLY